jgi:type I restriction enzyme M protein
VVLANPPYSVNQWNRAAWMNDPYGRNTLGTPPQSRADYAFFQHILASMDRHSGRCAILFPHGVLFRDEERHMRTRLVERDVVECVLGLGPNLFYNSPMEACVVVCRSVKPAERRGKILFINAVNEVTRERAQSFLREEHIQKIVGTYRGFRDIEAFAGVATLDEIRANGCNLSIPLYVSALRERERVSNRKEPLLEAIAAWQQSSRELRVSMDDLFATLEEASLGR